MTNRPKYIIVTGSSGGVGLGIVNKFLDSGFHVIGIDVVSPKKKLRQDNYFKFIQFDLSCLCDDKSFSNLLLNKVLEILKNGKLQSIINNAAVQIIKSDSKSTLSNWTKSLSINLITPAIMSSMFFDHLAKSKGSIINIGSVHSKLSKPNFEMYSTSKSGLIGLTKALALKYAPDVRVNLVEPGAVETQMLKAGFSNNKFKLDSLKQFHPLKKLANTKDIAELVFFLCSVKANSITGATISIDNGIGLVLHDPSN
jgi:NAD(P)-dependent dehydrogenase (short-subunit alcohol dehydrogenase family)